MHSNHVLKITGNTLKIYDLSNACLQHYNLDMSIGAKLKTQCFFNANNELTDITWQGQILVPGMPYWRDIAALVKTSIDQQSLVTDILKLAKVSEYQSIQSMHDLADKYCSGISTAC